MSQQEAVATTETPQLAKANITVNRKMLAEIAVTDMNAFKKLVESAKA